MVLAGPVFRLDYVSALGSPTDSHVEVPQDVTLSEEKGLTERIKLKRPLGGPEANVTSVLTKRGNLEADTHTHRGRMPYEHKVGHLQAKREAWNRFFSHRPQKEATSQIRIS